MSRIPEEARFRLGGALAYVVARSLCSTVRFELEDPARRLRGAGADEPVVVVAWHDQLLPLIHVLRDRGLAALVSEHADGEFLARVLRHYGFRTARGSSTRGGTRGLRDLLRAARSGRGLAVTPDGPRGPRHRFKEGALLAAQLTGLPVLPMACAASSAWRFGSWDRFMLPRPFSTVRVVCGRTRTVPRRSDRDARRRLAKDLEELLEALTARAAREAEPDLVHGRQRTPPHAPEGPGAGTPPGDRSREGREEDRAPTP